MTAPLTAARAGRARRRRLRGTTLLLLLSAAAAPALQPLAAQAAPAGAAATPTSAWRTARTGKWVLLGAAVLFGAYAVQRSNEANEAYDALRGACESDAERCRLSDGRYADPATEALFDRAEREDARAQVGIVGGQVALLGSVGLFVYDLRNARGPRNIPYPGRATAAGATPPAAGIAVGLRFTF
jgi:hypothetical protein